MFDHPTPNQPVDLALHDRPHASANVEWWYYNAHFGKHSFFLALFRHDLTCPQRNTHGHTVYTQPSHSLVWALVDTETQTHTADVVMDASIRDHLVAMIKAGKCETLDPRIQAVLLAWHNQGQWVGPDRIAEQPARVATDKLDISFDQTTLFRASDGHYFVNARNGKMWVALVFKPLKPAFKQFGDGYVKMNSGTDSMYYYTISRCEVSGTFSTGAKPEEAVGLGWYDHQFGTFDFKDADPLASNRHYGWHWLSLQLTDGTDVSASRLFDDDMKLMETSVTVCMADGKVVTKPSPADPLQILGTWQSTRTMNSYPISWLLKCTVGADELNLTATVAFPEQEALTMMARGAFYEGRLNVTGHWNRLNGQRDQVRGLGFLECHQPPVYRSVDKLIKAAGQMTLKQVENYLPRQLDAGMVQRYSGLSEPLNTQVIEKYVVHPIRDIIDRGGKTWRSYVLLLCIDAVGGNSQRYCTWLPMPEIYHVGSLIIDDIQDKSLVRRGGPCVHLTYGQDHAINAGTCAYFLAPLAIQQSTWLTAEQKVEIYEAIQLVLRAGHIGQALDLAGYPDLIQQAVITGDTKELEQRILQTHRLKSAESPGWLARIGGILGGGSPAQLVALQRHFTNIGIAFQMMDDVHNLRGFENKSKVRGEDIRAGKMTYPIAKYVGTLPTVEARRQFIENLTAKLDQTEIESLCDQIETAGVLKATEAEAYGMVDASWGQLAPLLPETIFKVMVQVISTYLLQQHY